MKKYKEVSANRRHYSALRFALLPFYFGIQGAIAQTAYNDKATLPFFVCALAGVLSTYVFWTIEERISDYYNHFEQVGAKLEEELNFGEKMFVNWPKSKFMSNTKRSIRSAYFLCTAFWIVYLCMELIKS